MCGLFIIFWGALIALVLWFFFRDRPDVRQRVSSIFAGPEPQADAAEEILRERLARGEIDAEEYERALDALRR